VDVTTGALSGTGVYVAANGDEIAFTFTGTAELTFTDPTDATVTFEVVQDLSGGTGRFAAVDGTAEVTVRHDSTSSRGGLGRVDARRGAGVLNQGSGRNHQRQDPSPHHGRALPRNEWGAVDAYHSPAPTQVLTLSLTGPRTRRNDSSSEREV
jgi:hypothetical protein